MTDLDLKEEARGGEIGAYASKMSKKRNRVLNLVASDIRQPTTIEAIQNARPSDLGLKRVICSD